MVLELPWKHIWVCLQRYFQKGLAEQGRLNLNMDNTISEAIVRDLTKRRYGTGYKYLPFSVFLWRTNLEPTHLLPCLLAIVNYMPYYCKTMQIPLSLSCLCQYLLSHSYGKAHMQGSWLLSYSMNLKCATEIFSVR